MTWEVIRPEIKILQADSGFYWELWNNGEPVLQSLKNYPRATVEDFIEWLRQDFAEIALNPYERCGDAFSSNIDTCRERALSFGTTDRWRSLL